MDAQNMLDQVKGYFQRSGWPKAVTTAALAKVGEAEALPFQARAWADVVETVDRVLLGELGVTIEASLDPRQQAERALTLIDAYLARVPRPVSPVQSVADHLLTPRQAAAVLGVTVDTVNKYLYRSHRLTPVRLGGGVFIERSEVEAFEKPDNGRPAVVVNESDAEGARG